MTIKEKLKAVQVELKAPKNLYNKFGNYYYRNAEGICEAVKPFLDKYNVTLTIWDEVVAIGDRIYVKAYAELKDCESDACVITTAFAREADDKKGMDSAQVTGATSSYARKYALNGLFLLDDTKDVDTEEYQTQNKPKTATPKSTTKTAPKTEPVNSTVAEALGGLPFEIE